MRTTATLTTLLALAACNPQPDAPVEPEAPFGRVAGFVTDIDGKEVLFIDASSGLALKRVGVQGTPRSGGRLPVGADP